jgi:hypothetical protein
VFVNITKVQVWSSRMKSISSSGIEFTIVSITVAFADHRNFAGGQSMRDHQHRPHRRALGPISIRITGTLEVWTATSQDPYTLACLCSSRSSSSSSGGGTQRNCRPQIGRPRRTRDEEDGGVAENTATSKIHTKAQRRRAGIGSKQTPELEKRCAEKVGNALPGANQ